MILPPCFQSRVEPSDAYFPSPVATEEVTRYGRRHTSQNDEDGVEQGFLEQCTGGRLWEPDEAAERVFMVVRGVDEYNRGRVWDWAGEEVVR